MSEEWKLQASFKSPGGTLINVRAGSGAELEILLGDVKEITTQISAVETELGVAHTIAPLGTTPFTQGPAPVQNYQAQSVQPPSGTGPTCQHGNRIFKSGVSKSTGKPYSMWVCPTPQGTPDQCKPAFA